MNCFSNTVCRPEEGRRLWLVCYRLDLDANPLKGKKQAATSAARWPEQAVGPHGSHLLCLPNFGIAAAPQPPLQLLVAGTAKQAIWSLRRGGSTQTSPPEKALGILRRCGASRYGRPSPREATEALVRVLDAFEAAPRVLDVGNSVIVPSTDDIALKMEERQDIDLCRSNDWSQFLRGAAWRPVFHASVEALDAARRYLSCPTPSPPPGARARFWATTSSGRSAATGPICKRGRSCSAC